jgi:two-component system sensor histidine kinase UhpB
MSLIVRLNLTVSILLVTIFILVVFKVVFTTADNLNQVAHQNFELSTRMLDVKTKFIRSIPVEMLRPFPSITVTDERKLALISFDQFRDIDYVKVELFDSQHQLMATNVDGDTQPVHLIPDLIRQHVTQYFFAEEMFKSRTLAIGDMHLGDIEISTNRDVLLNDFWYQTLSALSPVMILFMVISLSLSFIISIFIRPIIDFIRAVGHQGLLDSQQGSVFSRLSHLIGLRLHLQGIRHKIQDTHEKVHELNTRILQLQEEERRRLSAELHDELGQHITAIRLETEVIRTTDSLDDAKQSAESIDSIGRHIKDIVRSLLERLRPPDLDMYGLQGALSELIAGWKMRNPKAEIYFLCESDFSNFDDQQELTIYRIVQEGLTNISRHAGAGAINVDVLLIKTKDVLKITITDDGVGCDLSARAEGFGIIGMRERVEGLHGTIRMKSKPNQGMKITAEIPINQVR